MDLADIPLFSMLRGRLSYLSERQKLIAQNVANSDTPGFAPKDLKPFSFHTQTAAAAPGTAMAGVQAVTHASHMVAPNARRPGGVSLKQTKSEVIETTLDGNSVSLEEEMLKMSDARMQYDAAIGFYQKSLNLLRLAAKPPGRA
ncbi:flagellar basal body rod protein FlgB [Phenylobacterium sp.]|uniref:flagellar basal body rod protein FlgB n=1 Tax=Phenylobacterium sp. TaxID=1871053 RepID=UPI002F92F347